MEDQKKPNAAEIVLNYENMSRPGQERRGIYKLEKNRPSYEEEKRKLETFTYDVLEKAEKEELSLIELKKVAERITRYAEIASYNIEGNTKFNAPGCYLW